jgi:zinc/manganese transport system substrate-binding protein
MCRRGIVFCLALLGVLAGGPAAAQDRIKVVATFSILADLVQNVGGERVDVSSLVGPDGDAHVYSPTPADAKRLSGARLIVVNGLGFEGWINRLITAAASKPPTVVASQGVRPRKLGDGHRDHGHADGADDPHAWQSVANARIYVANIRDALSKADPAGKRAYAANANAYLDRLDALERELRETIAKIAPERRRIITTHDAFGYFADAYGVAFIPAMISTQSAPSASGVAKIIAQVKKQKIPAVFLENMTDPRLMQQIARETGAKIGGALYSDALSGPGGPAPTYIDMMRHNMRELSKALTT